MDKDKTVYSAIIPVFNESDNIEPLYKRLKRVLGNLNAPYEIIFVDDGSSDVSYMILKKIALADSSVRVISFVKNFGQHKAVVAGIREATGDYIITLDADLQNPPEEIPNLLKVLSEEFDMVSGYRRVRKDSIGRRIGSLGTNMLIALITGRVMHDYGSMLRVFKKDTAKKLAELFDESEGYITMLAVKITRKIAEIEVSHDNRYSGSSKYGFSKLVTTFGKIFRYNDTLRKLLFKKRVEPLYIINKRISDGREKIFSN